MKNLKRLFRSRDVRGALNGMAEDFGLGMRVVAPDGMLLWATPDMQDATGLPACPSHPIEIDRETVGTVYLSQGGSLTARTLATLLAHLVRQESEKSALIQDALSRYGEVTAYYELSRKLAGNLKPDQVAKTVLTEATAQIKADRGCVLIRRDDGAGLELLAYLGAAPPKHVYGIAPSGITGAVYNSGQAEIVNDPENDPRYMPGDNIVRAVMAVPLVAKGDAIGVVCLTTSEHHEYRTQDLNLLSALCVSAASAMENARLYSNLERRVASRTFELFETLNRFNHELVKAGEYVKSLIPPPAEYPGLRTDWRFVPSTSLGGDIFGYHWMDTDRFVVYLLDVCGHGIGAALLSVSVKNVLRTHALPDTDFARPAQVLAALNRTFPMADQNGMYFTIWYGVLNRTTRSLDYASGGHFPALLFPGEETTCGSGQPPSELATGNIFIGGVPDFPYTEATTQLPESGRLYVFSDGTFEHRQPDGTMWEYEDFKTFLKDSTHASKCGRLAGSPMDRLLAYAQRLHQSPTLKDDFTILQIDFASVPEPE